MKECKCDCHWLLAALIDSFEDEPLNAPWAACVPLELLNKCKDAVKRENK